MSYNGTRERLAAATGQLTDVTEIVWHWAGTAAAAVTAYMMYTEADILSLAAMGVGLFAVLLLVRSIGVTAEQMR